MRLLYLIRGLPGAGKTTFANSLVDSFVIEADMYFTVNGIYKHDKEMLPLAHAWCQAKVRDAMEDNFESIAVSNTFSQRWEMERYYELAKIFNYALIELTINTRLTVDELVARNVHQVPKEVIQKMKDRWEF